MIRALDSSLYDSLFRPNGLTAQEQVEPEQMKLLLQENKKLQETILSLVSKQVQSEEQPEHAATESEPYVVGEAGNRVVV